eukprot:CAMPEP_0182816602 /NCGR_PEP_ID=MMETSP0006_2-20121128/11023_1 /TAXON_ID=97485 /ORGANISM="Prymnesium parvum, Strain Texoma1" /LENGTH=465 /DNA_ID=CAMNT_0024942901 /DNA_START=266 /DNA_END=1663 /DNA_ORIENTATION=+
MAMKTNKLQVTRGGTRKEIAAKNRKRYVDQLAREEAEVESWFRDFDWNRSNKLEKDELMALLKHLNPRHEPTPEAIDYLITKATEISTYSMHLKGDANSGVDRGNIRMVLKQYRAHIREQEYIDAIFRKHDRDNRGKLNRKELLSLLNDAVPGSSADDEDVDFILAKCDLNKDRMIDRDELLPTLVVWRAIGVQKKTDLQKQREVVQRSAAASVLSNMLKKSPMPSPRVESTAASPAPSPRVPDGAASLALRWRAEVAKKSRRYKEQHEETARTLLQATPMRRMSAPMQWYSRDSRATPPIVDVRSLRRSLRAEARMDAGFGYDAGSEKSSNKVPESTMSQDHHLFGIEDSSSHDEGNNNEDGAGKRAESIARPRADAPHAREQPAPEAAGCGEPIAAAAPASVATPRAVDTPRSVGTPQAVDTPRSVGTPPPRQGFEMGHKLYVTVPSRASSSKHEETSVCVIL